MSLNAEGFYRANGYKPEAHVRRDLARGATIDCLRMAKLALSATRAPNETAVPFSADKDPDRLSGADAFAHAAFVSLEARRSGVPSALIDEAVAVVPADATWAGLFAPRRLACFRPSRRNWCRR